MTFHPIGAATAAGVGPDIDGDGDALSFEGRDTAQPSDISLLFIYSNEGEKEAAFDFGGFVEGTRREGRG